MNKIVLVFGILLSSSVAYGQGLVIRHIPNSIQSNLDVPDNLPNSTFDFKSSLGRIVQASESNVSDNKLEEDSNKSNLDFSEGSSSNIPVKDFPSRLRKFSKKPVKFGIQLGGIKK